MPGALTFQHVVMRRLTSSSVHRPGCTLGQVELRQGLSLGWQGCLSADGPYQAAPPAWTPGLSHP